MTLSLLDICFKNTCRIRKTDMFDSNKIKIMCTTNVKQFFLTCTGKTSYIHIGLYTNCPVDAYI